MNVKKNDTVIVLSGKDKGKKGKVLEAMPAAGKVVVEGVNVATCHVKPKKQGDQGGIINREIPMYASKVMLVCPKCGKKMLAKKSKKGKQFYGCEDYQNCNFMTWDLPISEKCPQCGATLFKKTGRQGKIYCAKEGCGYERPLDSADSKDKSNDS